MFAGGKAKITGGFQCIDIYAGRYFCDQKCQDSGIFSPDAWEYLNITCSQFFVIGNDSNSANLLFTCSCMSEPSPKSGVTL